MGIEHLIKSQSGKAGRVPKHWNQGVILIAQHIREPVRISDRIAAART